MVSANRVEEEFIFFPVYSVLPITVWLQSVSAINVGWYLPARHSGRDMGCEGGEKSSVKVIGKANRKEHTREVHKSRPFNAASRKWLTVECTADDIIISYYIFYFYSLLFERQFKSDLTRHLGDHE